MMTTIRLNIVYIQYRNECINTNKRSTGDESSLSWLQGITAFRVLSIGTKTV